MLPPRERACRTAADYGRGNAATIGTDQMQDVTPRCLLIPIDDVRALEIKGELTNRQHRKPVVRIEIHPGSRDLTDVHQVLDPKSDRTRYPPRGRRRGTTRTARREAKQQAGRLGGDHVAEERRFGWETNNVLNFDGPVFC